MSEIARVHELVDQGLTYMESSRICGEAMTEGLGNAQGHIEDAAHALAIALESLEKAGAEFRVASNKSVGARENFGGARNKFTDAAGAGDQSSSIQELLDLMQPHRLGADLELVVDSSRNAHKTVTSILQDAKLQRSLEITREMLNETRLPYVRERAHVYVSNNVPYIKQEVTRWKDSL